MSFMALLLVLLIFFSASASSGRTHPPKAQNVTWSSHNFKTVLTWGPKPSNYTYTVEFSGVGKDRRTNPHCIRTQETACDLTKDLLDLKSSYTADVLSELSGADLVELPFTQSKKFCPYNDTLIGKPEFSIKQDENLTVVIVIQDQLTALHKHGDPLTIRDVFGANLKYKITYFKAGSTGPRTVVVGGGEVKMTELDEGQSYCFRVASFLPSRRAKRVGRWSPTQCSATGARGLIHELGPWVVGSGLLLMVFLLAIVVLTVFYCIRTKKGKQAEDSEAITHV